MGRVILEGLSKRFDSGAAAVDNLNLTIEHGEFCVLVGPSGCGKSTTLRMIAGLESPTAGTITIGDRVVNDVDPADRDIAMVFQDYALYPHMSVRGNLSFGLRMRGTPKQEIEDRVSHAASLLELTDLLDRRPRALSGGQRQRVALGRAIVREPAVFLFDEPLSNLDAQLRVQMRAELSRLHARLGATMIYVTHDQVEAMTMGQRLAVMNQGRLCQAAAPTDIYRTPADRFTAEFIGSPSMNFLRGQVHAGSPARFESASGSVELPGVESESRDVELGVRPEGVLLSEGGGGIEGEVVLVEPLGPETLVHIRLESTDWVVRCANAVPDLGARVGLYVQPDSAHLFAPQTGESLNAGGYE